jgi:hypothetical protein
MPRSTPPQPTPAERAASKAQDERLKKAKVTTKEGKVIDSANRSEGSAKRFAAAGIVKKLPTSKQMGNMNMAKGAKVSAAPKFGKALVKKSADTKGRAMMKKAGGGSCYAKGGSVSSRADGCATKGKTNTKMVAMKNGGSC